MQSSTASAGKFDEKLPDEIKVKQKGKQHKRDPVIGDLSAERDRQLKLLGKLHAKPLTITTKKGARYTFSLTSTLDFSFSTKLFNSWPRCLNLHIRHHHHTSAHLHTHTHTHTHTHKFTHKFVRRLADDSRPSSGGVAKTGAKRSAVQTRFAPKGPSKKAKKQGAK